MMDKAVAIIQKRGKSTIGEKTMNDTLMPALDALKAAHDAGDDIKTAMGKAVEAEYDLQLPQNRFLLFEKTKPASTAT